MHDSLVAAVCQMNSGIDKARNLATAERLIRAAAAQGAELIALPELFNCLGPLPEIIAQAEPIPGPTSERLAHLARELQITLCGGSICERAPVPGKGYNTTLMLNAAGEITGTYRKLHLFDVLIPGTASVAESDFMIRGEQLLVTTCHGARLGHATCYDLRFPELFRALSHEGIDLLLIPAAFTYATGRDHWEVLLRARAIENQAFVVAPNQCGRHGGGLRSFGHSLIVDPWGEVLARGSAEEEQVVVARLEASRLLSVRSKIPCLRHRRL